MSSAISNFSQSINSEVDGFFFKPGMSRSQVRYIMGCLRLLLEDGHDAMQPREDVYRAYNEFIDAGNKETAWGAPYVRSWYKNADGRVTQNWPGTHLGFWEITQAPDPDNFEFL